MFDYALRVERSKVIKIKMVKKFLRVIIDSSAILAILLTENDADVFADVIASAERRIIGSFSHLECSAVLLAQKGPVALS